MDFSSLKQKQHFFADDKGLVSHFWHLQQINTFSKQRVLKPNPNHLAGAAPSPHEVPHLGNFCSSQISSFHTAAKQWHPDSRGDQTVMKRLKSIGMR